MLVNILSTGGASFFAKVKQGEQQVAAAILKWVKVDSKISLLIWTELGKN